MKRLLLIIFVVISLLVSTNVFAQDVHATATWEQPDYAKVNYWVLYWGLSPGGPYVEGNVTITKELLQPNQTAPVMITYPADVKTTYYYVLIAFKDRDHFSGFSNEADLEVDFIELPLEPVQFNIIIRPAP